MIHIKTCKFCNRKTRGYKTFKDGTIVSCTRCGKFIEKQVSQAYEIQHQWEKSLNEIHKKIIYLLKTEKNMSMQDISIKLNIDICIISKNMKKLKNLMEKHYDTKKGYFVYTYNTTENTIIDKMLKNDIRTV